MTADTVVPRKGRQVVPRKGRQVDLNPPVALLTWAYAAGLDGVLNERWRLSKSALDRKLGK